jgi:uncharacterized protein (DUF983 family)
MSGAKAHTSPSHTEPFDIEKAAAAKTAAAFLRSGSSILPRRQIHLADRFAMSSPGAANLWRSGLLCRCPRCGLGRLFAGYLKVAPRCAVCDLDLAFAEHGDGPAVFVVLIAGTVVMATAMFLELRFSPPLWVHGLVLGPMTVALCLGLLPVLKAFFVAMQFRYRREDD